MRKERGIYKKDFNAKINNHSKEAPHTIVDIYGHLVPVTNRSAVDKLDDALEKSASARTPGAPGSAFDE